MRRTTFSVQFAAFMVLGCGSDPTEQAAPAASSLAAAPSQSAPIASASAQAVRGTDEITPVYPKDNLPPEPIATRYCAAVHGVVSERRAKCCKEDPRTTAEGECVRTLSSALRSKAVTMEEAVVARCEEASKKAFDGCDWVGMGAHAAPDECIGILRGTLAEGAVCRSSLECTGKLRCFGLGATQPGRCVKSRPTNSLCGTGVDTLAGLTAQDTWERVHPECEGSCVQKRCRDAAATGAACKVGLDCGPGRSCRSGACSTEPLPAIAAPCAEGECARGLRCVEGKCAKARPAGESCKADFDCAGACENGKCAQLCRRAMPRDLIPRPSAKTTKPGAPR